MKPSRLNVQAIALGMVGLLAMAQTQSQNIYKCGNNYGDTPCPQGVAVPTADPRSPAQKAQTDQATINAKSLGGELEKTRLASEAAADRRSQFQAKAVAQAAQSAQKTEAAAKRAEAKAKGKQPKTKLIKRKMTKPASSGKLRSSGTIDRPPSSKAKAPAKAKLTQ